MIDRPKPNIIKIATVGFFLIYLIAILLLAGNYGTCIDEMDQRKHALVEYKFYNKVIFHRNIPELENVPDPVDYPLSSTYGMFLQLPLVFIEDCFNFTLPTKTIFWIHHIYIALMCYFGYFTFYILMGKLFTDKRLPLIGVMLLSLYPRFFGAQFYDVKNMLFTATTCWTLLAMWLAVEKRGLLSGVAFGIIAGIATNTRMIGIAFPVILLLFFVLKDVIDIVKDRTAFAHDWKRRVGSYIAIIFVFSIVWYFLKPRFWGEGFISALKQAISTTNGNEILMDKTMIFMGKTVTSSELPLLYIPVWLSVSVPVFHLVLFVVGQVRYIGGLIKTKQKCTYLIEKRKWIACFFAIFWGSIIAIPITHGTIYLTWHHLYFIFIPMCGIGVFGLEGILKRLKETGVRYVYCAMGTLLAVLCVWITINHPFEEMFFNVFSRSYAADYDRDIERVSSYNMIKWILANDDGTVCITGENNGYYSLTDEEKKRVYIPRSSKRYYLENDVDLEHTGVEMGDTIYLLETYRNLSGNIAVHEGYSEVYSIIIDGTKIGTVFRKDRVIDAEGVS